jgi:hypothetical protein
MDYRCGRCGYTFTATSQTEYVKLLRDHRGGYCLAVLNPMTSDQISYLMNDIGRLMKPEHTIKDLMVVLNSIANWKAQQERTDSPAEGPAGESGG